MKRILMLSALAATLLVSSGSTASDSMSAAECELACPVECCDPSACPLPCSDSCDIEGAQQQ